MQNACVADNMQQSDKQGSEAASRLELRWVGLANAVSVAHVGRTKRGGWGTPRVLIGLSSQSITKLGSMQVAD